eukprot:g4133.t1
MHRYGLLPQHTAQICSKLESMQTDMFLGCMLETKNSNTHRLENFLHASPSHPLAYSTRNHTLERTARPAGEGGVPGQMAADLVDDDGIDLHALETKLESNFEAQEQYEGLLWKKTTSGLASSRGRWLPRYYVWSSREKKLYYWKDAQAQEAVSEQREQEDEK